MTFLKFKVNRWVWVAGVVVFAVLAGLWLVRSRQANEQKALLSLASSTVSKLSLAQIEDLGRQKGVLEKRLSEASEKLDAERLNLFSTSESVVVSETVFETAAVVGVDVVEVKSGGLSSDTFQGLRVQTLSISIKARGDMPSLIKFVSALGVSFPTSLVKSVDVDSTDVMVAAGPGQTARTTVERPSAEIVLAIYSYSGGGNG